MYVLSCSLSFQTHITINQLKVVVVTTSSNPMIMIMLTVPGLHIEETPADHDFT